MFLSLLSFLVKLAHGPALLLESLACHELRVFLPCVHNVLEAAFNLFFLLGFHLHLLLIEFTLASFTWLSERPSNNVPLSNS